MLEKFVAASGRMVKPRENGSVMFDLGWGFLTREAAFDAEEFFQARHDEELDRWRSGADPTYVVYETHKPDVVLVLDESDGTTWFYHRDEVSVSASTSRRVALTYFATHPVSRPWHAAAEGEFWRVIHNGMTEVCQVRGGRFEGVDGTIGSRVSMPVTHHSITDAAQMVATEPSSQAGLQSFRGTL